MSDPKPASSNPAPAPAPAPIHRIGFFSLAMINVAAVFSLRNAPGMADYGFALVFYLIFACLFFFIPSALVSAELAATYPEKGGVYLWVKKAYGPEYGFVAIFMQWVMNIPWYPAAFTFVASAIAYMFDPGLATNKWFVIAVIWVGIWAGTFFNFRGMKMSAFLSTSGVIAGTLIPGVIIIGLGIAFVALGHPSAISFSGSAFFPELGNFSQLMLLAAVVNQLTGNNPGRRA